MIHPARRLTKEGTNSDRNAIWKRGNTVKEGGGG